MHAFFTGSTSGLSPEALRWGVKKGLWVRVERDLYRTGGRPPTAFDRSYAMAAARDGIASGAFAGTLLGLDAMCLQAPDVTLAPTASNSRSRVRRRELPDDRIIVVDGIRCTDGLQTLIDLAASLSDAEWEQALESALRQKLVTVDDLWAALPELGRSRTPGTRRIRRVLSLRPEGAPPTESYLETLAVQIARKAGLPTLTRQYEVKNIWGQFVARTDLCEPDVGFFFELDGQQHRGQPVYDARRETAIVAAKGWLPGRFTYTECTRYPVSTGRRMREIEAQARARPRLWLVS